MEGFIPFSRPTIDEDEIAEVAQALRDGWVTEGPRVKRLEDQFREAVGARHAIATASGTAALHVALAAAGVGPGDEVITTPFTFVATVNAVRYVGATPVLADIDVHDYDLSPEAVERRLSPRTRAIIPVHMAGQPCRMDELLRLAAGQGAVVIEDAAHAAGASYRGRPIGSIAPMTAFSFYASKNMTTGEGGMLTLGDDGLAERARLLAHQGLTRDSWARYSRNGHWHYDVPELGFKCNLSDVAAAIGIHQLRKLPDFLAARQRVASLYDRALADLEEVELPRVRPEVRHAWHLYIVRLRTEMLTIGRDEFIALLGQRGIAASVHYIPVHHFSYYRRLLGDLSGELPNTERVAPCVVSLPIYPALRDEEALTVAEAVRGILRRHRR
ncbi:MAG TPA: DegT/DnrJ/EryC1/StrS aminotransferase family protein [Dehalococcoidia bacterium]|nr:DegT/DnrJ/EryC1/StrS aminotransferase family protein [Dehalococcoidia bacterium]